MDDNKMDEKESKLEDDDLMLPEYDFSGGIRGKHTEAYRRGYKIIMHKSDGSSEERDYVLPDGAIILDPDVRAYFPDSEYVNNTLRELIKLIPN